MTTAGEQVLRRHRAVTIGALVFLAALAWAWLVSGAGMGMAAQFDAAFLPHRAPRMAMVMPWDASRLAITFSMWFVMMVAMMLPAAAPVVLLYARAARSATGSPPATTVFLAGYLVAWLLFSLAAVVLQVALETSGVLDAMAMTLSNRLLAGATLIAAGLYQWSAAKNACLSHCRNPAEFIARHHRAGPLRMGMIHGSYCVGCCWLLMALLFVGGVMNLLWIAALTLIVAAEKLLPHGDRIARLGGALFLVWGSAVLLVG